MPPRSRTLAFDQLSTALAFAALGLAACLMPAQSDTWWHLRAGQDIWRTGHITLRDTFSHTAYGAYWPNHEWLSQAIFYGVYRVGGLPLLTGVAATLAVAAWGIVWRLTPGSEWQRLAMVGAAVIPVSLSWSLRPQMFTLFLFALTFLLLRRERYAALPVIFFVWANLHGAVAIGLLLMVVALAHAAVRARAIPRRLLAVAVLCVAATAMTPLGLSFWKEIAASLSRIHEYPIDEWRRPGVTDWRYLPFWGAGATLVVLAVKEHARRANGADLTVWAALALLPLAAMSARHVPPFMVLAVPAIATMLASGAPHVGTVERRVDHPHLNVALLGAGIIGALAIVATSWVSQPERLGWHPIPAQAIAAVESCRGRLYNRYDEGGYLVWFAPRQKVFLDGRQDPYPPALIREQMQVEASGHYEPTFTRYGITCAFLPSDSLMTVALAHEGWHREFEDAHWAVLSRR